MAELEFVVSVDSKGFAKVGKLKNEFKDVSKTSKDAGKNIDGFASSMKTLVPLISGDSLFKFGKNAKKNVDGFSSSMKALASFIAGSALFKFGKDALTAQGNLESLELQFRPLLGSAEEAKKRIQELSEFASRTPFQLPEIAKASKVLETLTDGVLSTGNGLRLVGDSASVAGVGFEELAVHVGRAFSNLQANRGAGESLARLQELGLLSGEVRNQIEDLQKVAKGKEAWEVLQSELKKTEGAMDGLADTFQGKLSTLSDNWMLFTADIASGSGGFSIAKDTLDALIDSVEDLRFAIRGTTDVADKSIKLNDTFDKLKNSLESLDEVQKKIEFEEMRTDIHRSEEAINALESSLVNQEKAVKESAKAYIELGGQSSVVERLFRLQGMALDDLNLSYNANGKLQSIYDKQVADAFVQDQIRKKQERETLIANSKLKKDKLIEDQTATEEYIKQVEQQWLEHDERERERLETYFATIEENDRVLREMQYNQFDLERMAIQEDYDLKLQILGNNEEEKLKLRQIYSNRMTSVAQRETDAYIALEEEKQRSYIETARIQTMSFANITEAGAVLFKKSKALAVANAVMQAGVASMNAMATQPFFPLGLSMFGLAVANGVDTVRKIQSASYVQGGIVDGGEQFIRINERGSSRPESILNSRATAYLGRQGVEMLNNGRFDVLEKQGGGNTINVNVNGVLSRDVYENEIKPLMNEDMSYR